MKALFRFVRLCLALLISQLLLLAFFLVLVGGWFGARQSGPVLEPHTLLRLTLSGEIIEYATLPEVPVLRSRPLTQTDILTAIEDAAEDVNIDAVLVDLAQPGIGWGKAHELHDALLRFRESGKSAWAWGATLDEIDLYVAAACDSLFVPPTGRLFVNGIGIAGMYLKGTFDKVGIRPNFSRTGAYKSAPETNTRADMSPEDREQNSWLLDDLWTDFQDTVLSGRGLTGSNLDAALERGVLTAEEGRETGLVDGVRQLAELLSNFTDDNGEPRWVSLRDYRKTRRHQPGSGRAIAVVHSHGLILRGAHGYHPRMGPILGAASVVSDLEDAVADDDVAAIVLRIDSGGGEISASDMIGHAVAQARAVKPVVVSMVDVAASGGYMMAYQADRIVAMPTTITGSIGSYIGKYNARGLYEKLGITKDFVTRGDYPMLFSDYHDWTAAEESLLARHQWTDYDRWTAGIADQRGLSPREVDDVGRGRVWTGRQALEHGLVDALGTLQSAIEIARDLVSIPDDEALRLVHYPLPRGLLDVLLDDDQIFIAAVLQRAARAAAELPQGTSWSLVDLRVTR